MNDVLEINDLYKQVEKGEVKVRVVNKNIEFETLLEVSDFDKRLLKAGGASNYLRNKLKK
jgi:aconitate hydratase